MPKTDYAQNTEPVQFTFVYVPGFMHQAAAYEPVLASLKKLGHEAIAVENHPTANFDDKAIMLSKALMGLRNIVLSPHSRGGQVCQRTPAILEKIFPGVFEQLIGIEYVCAAMKRPADQALPSLSGPRMLVEEYEKGFIQSEGGLTTYDKQQAKNRFYGDCSDQLARKAIDMLEPQSRLDDSSPLQPQPFVPAAYIAAKEDKVISPVWAKWASQNYIGKQAEVLPGSHSPFLSRPDDLARTQVRLAYDLMQERQSL